MEVSLRIDGTLGEDRRLIGVPDLLSLWDRVCLLAHLDPDPLPSRRTSREHEAVRV